MDAVTKAAEAVTGAVSNATAPAAEKASDAGAAAQDGIGAKLAAAQEVAAEAVSDVKGAMGKLSSIFKA